MQISTVCTGNQVLRQIADQAPFLFTFQALLGHRDVSTTMIYPHVLQQGDQGAPSFLDDLSL